MAINWNDILVDLAGYLIDPKEKFLNKEQPRRSVRVAPAIRPQDIEAEYLRRWQDMQRMNQGERIGKLNEMQNRGNFGREFSMLKEVAQQNAGALENQRKIYRSFGPPTPKQTVPVPSTVDPDVPAQYQWKTDPASIQPPAPPTYGPSVRIHTPKEFLNKPEESATNPEELRPTTPRSELHYPMDEGARITTPEQFINKPKAVKKPKSPKAKPIDVTSLPSFPKVEQQSRPQVDPDLERKRNALLSVYGDTGLRSLNDDAYVQRKWNAGIRGQRARELQSNYNYQRTRNPGMDTARTSMYQGMGRVAQQQQPQLNEWNRTHSRDYYRNLGLNPQQIAARDARQEANKRRRLGYKA